MNIPVLNLDYALVDEELKNLFKDYGTVAPAKGMPDRFPGKSHDFGFVQMVNRPAGEKATGGLTGKMSNGESIKVNEARPGQC